MLRDVPGSFYSFLAGVAAAVGVNLVTDLASGRNDAGVVAQHLYLAAPWFAVSAFLAFTAALAERFGRELAMKDVSTLTRGELAEVSAEIFAGVRTRIYVGILGATACAVLGSVAVAHVEPQRVAGQPSTAAGTGEPEEEKLRVALFGWIPNAADDGFAALKDYIQTSHHSRTGQYIDVTFRFDEFYDPVGLAKLLETYDVVEMDAVMLGMVVDLGLVQPWPKPPRRNWHPAAVDASTVDGNIYGIPHWLCGFFLFTRSRELAQKASLKGLLKALESLGSPGPDIAGMFDGSWDVTGMYLSAWLDYGNPSIKGALLAAPNRRILEGFSALGARCREHGRSPCTDSQYSRAACLQTGLFDEAYCHSSEVNPASVRFARGEVDSLIGYSERLHYVLRHMPVDAHASIRVAGMPLGDQRRLPLFVDVLALSARCKSESCVSQATRFGNTYTNPQLVADTIMSRDVGKAGIPRYLLPADQDVYRSPDIAGDALYSQLRAIVEGAVAYPNDPIMYHYKEIFGEQLKAAFKP